MKKTAEEILNEYVKEVTGYENETFESLVDDGNDDGIGAIALNIVKACFYKYASQFHLTPTEAEINEAATDAMMRADLPLDGENDFIMGFKECFVWLQNYQTLPLGTTDTRSGFQTHGIEKPVITESEEGWNKPVDGYINVPDYLDPLINKLGHHYRIHAISECTSEAQMICNMVHAAEKFFKASQPNPAIAVIEAEISKLEKLQQDNYNDGIYWGIINVRKQNFISLKETILKQIKQ